MTDEEKKQKAMYYLECTFWDGVHNRSREYIDAHIAAAHYLIQSMFGGYKPDNWDEIMQAADAFDAQDEAEHAIRRAKGQ